jgi:hypothetical protein
MAEYTYQKRCIFMHDDYDVIIVGAGTAGSTAAIATAMMGANTLIVERNCFLGGSSSGGQVTPMMHAGMIGNADSSFINALVKQRLRAENYGAADPYENDGWFNPEMLKFILEDMYLEHGGHILYDTEFIESICENGVITGIVIHNKGGMQVIRGNIIIDCTGDADVAYSAGVPCFSGDEISQQNQSSSLRFMVGNIDIAKLQDYLKCIGETTILEDPLLEISAEWKTASPLRKLFQKAVDDGVLDYDDGCYFQAFTVPGMKSVMSFNCPEVQGINNTLDPDARTDIMIIGKKMIKRLYRFLTMYLPGFENSYILSVAAMPGVRESRRINGKYVLSETDYNNRSKFDDAIARTAYPVDIHGVLDEKRLPIRHMARGEYFEVPFRSLVPENIDNLLVGGRCISATFIAQSAIRIQAICRATGEAAGIAAAYCAQNKMNISKFDGKIAREMMTKNGAFL